MNYFCYGGKCSRDYGIYISGSGTYNVPERDITKVEVPGKNGSVTIDNKRFRNIDVTYPAFIREKFREYSDHTKRWLMLSP